MQKQSEELEINLVELFYVLKKRIAIILLTAVVLGIGAGIYFKYLVTPLYNSTAKLYILTSSTSITGFADIQIGSALTLDYLELIYSRPVIEEVIKNQELDETYESLSQKITIVNPEDTRILNITVTYDEPNTAKSIVDELAKVSQKQISKTMSTEEPSIVEEGYVNKNKVSPMVARNTLIASLLGALLAAGVIIILHLMNDTIRSTEDVEKHLGINVLASIPMKREEGSREKRKKRNNRVSSSSINMVHNSNEEKEEEVIK
ncbi:MAG: polysaccharide export protein [Lachnoclostridium sp.]|jgi:capsular polysaccharide biosynthesis protein|nr:polysaccharide export protein [Lachnoclostridium sp.]